MLLAAVILHERLARPQLAGVVLALAGITAVAAG
jgi:drug/metabolite transporter (DMT)-like permease